MDEIIRQVAEKANISPDQARKATQTVVDFLKQRLPPQMSSHVDAIMSGSGSTMEDTAKGLGGKLGL